MLQIYIEICLFLRQLTNIHAFFFPSIHEYSHYNDNDDKKVASGNDDNYSCQFNNETRFNIKASTSGKHIDI